jgi:hypothetical protein
MNHTHRPDITHRPPERCPMGSGWRARWRAYTLDLSRSPEAREARSRLSDAGGGVLLARVPIEWVPARVIGPAGERMPLSVERQEHATFEVEGHAVHLDRIKGTGSGPGFSLKAIIIHVDGVFSGSGWVFGMLGGGGNSFPAVALIGNGLVVVVGFGDFGYLGEPYVELRGFTGR